MGWRDAIAGTNPSAPSADLLRRKLPERCKTPGPRISPSLQITFPDAPRRIYVNRKTGEERINRHPSSLTAAARQTSERLKTDVRLNAGTSGEGGGGVSPKATWRRINEVIPHDSKKKKKKSGPRLKGIAGSHAGGQRVGSPYLRHLLRNDLS